MKKIDLNQILQSHFCTTNNLDNNSIKDAMLDFGKQLLELAYENAEGDIEDSTDNSDGFVVIDKQSILNTIKQIE